NGSREFESRTWTTRVAAKLSACQHGKPQLPPSAIKLPKGKLAINMGGYFTHGSQVPEARLRSDSPWLRCPPCNKRPLLTLNNTATPAGVPRMALPLVTTESKAKISESRNSPPGNTRRVFPVIRVALKANRLC